MMDWWMVIAYIFSMTCICVLRWVDGNDDAIDAAMKECGK